MMKGDGKSILPKVFQGKLRLKSRLHWPTQPDPGEKAWAIWRKIIRTDILAGRDSMNLKVSLGPWWDSKAVQHRQWGGYYDMVGGYLYR